MDRVTARELTLKVEEAAYVPSAMRDLETLLHGHLPATGPATALVLVLLERGGLEERAARARQALAAAAVIGIRAAAILGADAAARIPGALTPAGRIVVPEPPAMPNAPAALLGAAGPLELVTLEVARPGARTPTRSVATTRPTCGPPRSRTTRASSARSLGAQRSIWRMTPPDCTQGEQITGFRLPIRRTGRQACRSAGQPLE